MKRGADAVLVGGVVFASMATACAALFSSMAGSLSRSVGLSSLLLGAGAGLLAARSVVRADIGPDVPASTSRFLDLLALVAFAAVSIRQFGWIVFERGGSLLTLLPSNYGDLPLHWTYVSHLAGGAPFWPENPILTGERLRYPFGVDLLTAVFVQLGASLPALLARHGAGRRRARRPRVAALGGTVRGRRIPVRRRARGLPGPGDGSPRGLPGRRRLEEPLPRPLRAAARLPPGSPRGASSCCGPGAGVSCAARRASRPGSRAFSGARCRSSTSTRSSSSRCWRRCGGSAGAA